VIKQALMYAVALLFLGSIAAAQTDVEQASSQSTKGELESVNCRAMEVFVAKWKGASVVIFHQRDKADGPKLGELLQEHTGQEVEFETADGKHHRATLGRIKNCFGRGLLIFAADDANLGVKEDFILHFGDHP